MAKARVIIKRRKAVKNTRKITKVMQMISTARYQKAYKRAVSTKPYVKKIGELVASVAQALKAGGEDVTHPLLQEHTKKANKVAVLVVSANRGLAGGYNGNILRLATHTLQELESKGITPELYVSGKKGMAYFSSRRAMAQTFTNLGDNPKYLEIEPLAQKFIQEYVDGKIDALKVVYMQFLSAGQQRATVLNLLPLTGLAGAVGGAAGGSAEAVPAVHSLPSYDFSPSALEILDELLPVSVKISLFQAFVESVVSEHIVRMVAMKAATDNADKLVKKLTQDYNRARQSQITGELSELMGGVEALK